MQIQFWGNNIEKIIGNMYSTVLCRGNFYGILWKTLF
jgi:hypothetical protein